VLCVPACRFDIAATAPDVLAGRRTGSTSPPEALDVLGGPAYRFEIAALLPLESPLGTCGIARADRRAR
jgi:hypothetical protein